MKKNNFKKNEKTNKILKKPEKKFIDENKLENKLEKAYKILAKQKNISNKKASILIDRGLVLFNGKRLEIARKLVNLDSTFEVLDSKIKINFEDEKIIAVEKPIGMESSQVAKILKAELINRLDKDTSGIMLLAKNNDFKIKAINEFKEEKVLKKYIALVKGKIIEEIKIDKNIHVKKFGFKKNDYEKSLSVIFKKGLRAISIIRPIEIINKNISLVEVEILTGRTHQIRIHLSSINHPIIGDILYGGEKAKRLYLHCIETKILNYDFKSEIKYFTDF